MVISVRARLEALGADTPHEVWHLAGLAMALEAFTMRPVRLRKSSQIAALVAAIHLASVVPALAQTDDVRAQAHSAAMAGLEAYDQKKYAEALEHFTRAEELFHTPVHVLYRARALAQLGQLVKAREVFCTLRSELLRPDAPKPWKDAVQEATRECGELEARVPQVTIVVGGGGADVRVTRNGDPVPADTLGVPFPLDPGEHTFQAHGDNREPSSPVRVVLEEGSKKTVELNLGPAHMCSPGATQCAGDTVATCSSSGRWERKTRCAASQTCISGACVERSPEEEEEEGMSTLRLGAYVGFGVAVAGVAVGTIFLIQSGSTRSDAEAAYEACGREDCSDPVYDDTVDPLDVEADTQLGIGIAGLLVGGIGLATGITLLVMDSKQRREGPSEARVRPVIGLGYAGVEGRF